MRTAVAYGADRADPREEGRAELREHVTQSSDNVGQRNRRGSRKSQRAL